MSYENCPFCKTKGTLNDEDYEDEGEYGYYTHQFFCPSCEAEWDATERWTKTYEPMEVEIIERPGKNNIEHYTNKDDK